MGIKNLNKILKDIAPEIFVKMPLSAFAYKKIAIDISLYLCKYKVVMGDAWISAFISLVSCLRENNIHCTFVYDGKAPEEKTVEKEKRRQHKNKLCSKVKALEDAVEKFYDNGEVCELLRELEKKAGEKGKPMRRLLTGSKPKPYDISLATDEIKKVRNQIISITDEDIQLTKDLFDCLTIPYYVAPAEAETMCSELCINGVVDAVLSEDTDVLAYGTPFFLSKIDTRSNSVICINYEMMLDGLGFTEKEFLDLCIMCGTDYNDNIPRVGCKTSYKLLQEYGSIEEIESKKGLDVSVLNHVRGREMFRNFTKSGVTKVLYTGRPDFSKLEKFVFKKNIKCNVAAVRRAFCEQNNIVFT